MDLRITSIADRGDVKKERVVLKAVAATDVGDYAIFCSFTKDGQPTNYVPYMFWFPGQLISEGDLVVLYSKVGTSSEKKLESGRTAYFFYMSESNAIWAEKDFIPVLVHIDNWKTFAGV